MKQRSWPFWAGVVAPAAVIVVGVVLVVGMIKYNRVHNNAFAACDALTMSDGSARSEFGFQWLPPGFECVLYNEDGSVMRRERL